MGLHSLNRSRLHGNFIDAYKVFFGYLDLDPGLFFYFVSAARLEG